MRTGPAAPAYQARRTHRQHPHPPRLGARDRGVHDDDLVEPGATQVLQERERLRLGGHLDAGEPEPGDPGRDLGPDPVVPAVGVADPEQQSHQPCSTVRSRKCVAHEMQGS
ncbi:MAG TPA: hypothetical protein VFP51_07565 [Nocardioidaceae bacterium]|nr:hypothetical protein [Nocardioidaceae bacterium]